MAQSFGIRSLVNNGSGVTSSVSGSSSFGEQSLCSAIPSWGRQAFGNVGFEDGKLHSRRRRSGVRAYAKDVIELDDFSALGISRGASKREIKNAYRKLALKYHPDVCQGESCTRSFLQISRAYERAMLGLPPLSDDEDDSPDEYVEGCMGVDNDSWDEWEEWMGWEGAGTLDYSTHINPNLRI